MPMTIILSQLFFFQRYLNFSNVYTKFLADAAYCVFIIHSHVVVLMCYVYIKILEAAGMAVFAPGTSGTGGIFWAPPLLQPPNVAQLYVQTECHEAITWGGFFFIALTSELIVWPLAWCLAKLPLLNRIL
jgi:hypothetical protein